MNFLAIVIAAIASMIAYGQYRTAREKLILDLFDKRIEVYSVVVSTIEKVGGPNRMGVVFNDDIKQFDKALYPMSYLFGEEVEVSARILRRSLLKLMIQLGQDEYDLRDPERIDLEEGQTFEEIALEYGVACDEFLTLVRPYIIMDQKLPRSLSGWLRDVLSRFRS